MFRKATLSLALVLTAAGAVHAEDQSLTLRDGFDLHFTVAGPADAPPLILLHGLGDTRRSWSLVLPELARSHRVYVLDQRGHGATSAPLDGYSLGDLADDVLAFMDAMNLDRSAVAGHSMGSFVAQHLAAHHPDRVTRLVLLGSSDTTVGAEVMEWLVEQVAAFDQHPGAEFVESWQSNPTPVDAEFLRHVKAETLAVPLHVWRAVTATLATEDQRSALRNITAPVLILWGENDPAFLLQNQERLQAAILGATFKRYPKVGHNMHWEIPTVVAKDLLQFLEVSSPRERKLKTASF